MHGIAHAQPVSTLPDPHAHVLWLRGAHGDRTAHAATTRDTPVPTGAPRPDHPPPDGP